jgi:hypothetical protein
MGEEISRSMPKFDPQQEKETYQQTRKEILRLDWISLTLSAPYVVDMPSVYDCTILERSLQQVSILKKKLNIIFLELMKDETTLKELCGMIDHCAQEREVPTAHRVVNQVLCKNRTSGEFRLNVEIGEYDMENVILDLGFDVNFLLNKTCKMMGKPKLIWSPIQLRLENQHNIIPIGRLLGVHMSIDGVRSIKDFDT